MEVRFDLGLRVSCRSFQKEKQLAQLRNRRVVRIILWEYQEWILVLLRISKELEVSKKQINHSFRKQTKKTWVLTKSKIVVWVKEKI